MAREQSEYQVRVVFQAVLGPLEGKLKQTVSSMGKLGTTGKKAGKEGSQGLDQVKRSADHADESLRKTDQSAFNLGKTLKKALTGAAIAYTAKKIINLGESMVKEYGKTQTALGQVASLGYEDLSRLRKAAIDFSNTWSGTTREDFIASAYDIKSGIATLTDAGVADFTRLAALTAKATKASTADMTSLFATGYNIYRKFYQSDDAFGNAFAAGVAKSVQLFKTDGPQIAQAISAIGASASSANVPLNEQLSILGMLKGTMGGGEAGTKYRSFITNAARAGKALGLSFLDAKNQLKSMPDILDQLHKKFGDTMDAAEKMELTKAFGTDEAVSLIDLLYTKTGELRKNIDLVSQSIDGGTKSVEAMASKMNSGPLEKIQQIRQTWANLKDLMGEQISPGLSPALDGLHEKLLELEDSGDFTQLGESLGELVRAGGELFTKVLDRAPAAIQALAGSVKFLADHLDQAAFSVKALVAVWIGFKAVTAGKALFSAAVTGLGALVKVLGKAKKALALFKLAWNIGWDLNPIGLIIMLVAALIAWFVNATKGVDGWKNKFKVAMNDIQIGFFKFIRAITSKWADFIGFFHKSWGDAANEQVEKMDEKIEELQNTNDSLRGEAPKKRLPIGMKLMLDTVYKTAKAHMLENKGSTPIGGTLDTNSGGVSSVVGGVGGSAKTGKNPLQMRIQAIDDRYTDRLKNRELKADLAEGAGQSSVAKELKQQSVALLKRQANDLLHLENTQGGANRTIVDNARLSILKKIQELTSDIRDGVQRITGDFNNPSDISPMTRYQYLISDTKNVQRGQYFGNRSVEMYFNIKNPEGLGTAKLQEYMKQWGVTGATTLGGMSYDSAKEMASQVTRY